MTAFEFFGNLISLISFYTVQYVKIIFDTPAYAIPFCIAFGTGVFGIVWRILKG